MARSIEATRYRYVTSEYGSRSGTSGSATAVGYETTGFGTYVSTLASVGGSGSNPVTDATGPYAIGGACFASVPTHAYATYASVYADVYTTGSDGLTDSYASTYALAYSATTSAATRYATGATCAPVLVLAYGLTYGYTALAYYIWIMQLASLLMD